ncbi:hypothetical protein Syun_013477 [Stephania yunnanensis]|uniref:NADPH-dependent pterin aldehyde reductase n=1 Tax=Stephania yunnanensis TaxID=152371 RepID=A0AAP0JJQ8_9MAGN
MFAQVNICLSKEKKEASRNREKKKNWGENKQNKLPLRLRSRDIPAMADGNPHRHQTVLITGVGRGLGRALALEMARRGLTVIGCSRSSDHIQSLQSLLSSADHLFLQLDVRSDPSVALFAKQVIDSKGVPDILGTITRNNKFWDVPAEEVDSVIDTNVKGIANMLRHFVPPMIQNKRGIIVNFSSGWGRSPAAMVAPYCASKWAVEGLTRSVAKELPEGLAIVSLSPGVVNTEMLASCFGAGASQYQTPDSWAPKAATLLLNLTADDNGAILSVS